MKTLHLTLSVCALTLSTAVRLSAASIFDAPRDTDVIFRGQSPADGGVPMPMAAGVPGDGFLPGPASSEMMSADVYGGLPSDSVVTSPDGSLPMFQDSMTWNTFAPPVGSDPFVSPPGYGGQPSPYAPYSPYANNPAAAPGQGLSTYGANGAVPYRYGWTNSIDVSYLPSSGLTAPAGGATGDMDIFGVDYDMMYSTPFLAGWILNWTNQFRYRDWKGPEGGIGIPSSVFRLGMDFELETPQTGPYSISLGVTPSLNTDFDASTSKGFQLDGRGILLMQLDQYWTLGLGAMYWDRVKDRILPYAGLIYRDDYWEWQLMVPEARISLFLGNEAYWSKWIYVRGEYHVESFGISRSFGGVTADDEMEIADYRVLGGFKMDAGLYSWFIEGGWVFNREIDFANAAVPGYELDNGFIGQIGLRY
ncbi:MAG: hypothetical protein ACK526_00530 [Planctomyces sp.]